ncbi:MAG: TetR/AcrR family transcriptional regulator [Calditrichaeota bacterium]|nr:TetR/AcrR family transcriptional regulator [Calditrichota bacterium]
MTEELPNKKRKEKKYNDILVAAKKLFVAQGYEKTTVRQIVEEAKTSMGNLYYYFPDKLTILKTICEGFLNILRNQIFNIKTLSLRPEVGFALDFKIGFITTLEDPKLSKLWLVVRDIPEVHQYSLENKRIRLKTFFGNRISQKELDFLAIAIQGINDIFFEQKRDGTLTDNSGKVSNSIIKYSLLLLGYSLEEIKEVIDEVEEYIGKKNISVNEYF